MSCRQVGHALLSRPPQPVQRARRVGTHSAFHLPNTFPMYKDPDAEEGGASSTLGLLRLNERCQPSPYALAQLALA
jgi:hypothetical protein